MGKLFSSHTDFFFHFLVVALLATAFSFHSYIQLVFLDPEIGTYQQLASASASLSSGLVGHWNFDEGSGTTAGDSSGNNNTGTLRNGPTWVDGVKGKALDFDGVNDSVSAGNGATLQNLTSFTAAFWIKTTGLNSASQSYLLYKDSYQVSGFMILDNGPHSAAVICRTETSGSYADITIARSLLNDGKWHHYACTHNGTTKVVYLDGVQKGSANQPFVVNNTNGLGMGQFLGNAGGGTLDDVRVYNRALLSSEAKELYTDGGSITPSPTPVPTPPSLPFLPLPPTGSWAAFPNSKLRPAMSADRTPWYGSQAFIFDYSGGEFDAERNELIVWGGGHADYSGNEVCLFSLSTSTWTCTPRSVAPYAPSNPGYKETQDTLADGTPDSRHTYSCLARVNIPGWDGFFCHGGSLWQGGWPVNGTWFFHRDTKTWEKLPPRPLWGESEYGATSLSTFAAFDPVSKRVLVLGKGACMTFDFTTKAWEWKGSGDACRGGDYEKSAALDPERRLMVVMGAGSITPEYSFRVYDISKTPWTLVRSTLVGDQTPVRTRGTGLVFDPVGKRYIAHTGGKNLWVIDRDTWTVSVLPGSGADPGPMYPASGNMGRFRYVPSTNGLVVVNSVDGNVFYYQLGGTPPTPPPTDTTPPTISLTSPLSGVSVSGTITVSANASDDIGVVGVQFKLDGSNLGVENTLSPYSITWDSTTATNASHTLMATARDAAGNIGTTPPIIVTVNNAVPPPPTADIPERTWVRLPLPPWTSGSNTGVAITSHDKHVSLARNPDNGRIYFEGGDYYGQSYRQETWSLDVAARLGSTNPATGWALEYPYCGPSTQVQPKGQDFVGWTWDSLRHVFWMVPGEMQPHGAYGKLCPGEIPDSYTTDGNLIFRHIMTFDPATKRWTDVTPHATGGDTWAAVYDPKTDTLVHARKDYMMGVYTIATKTWTWISSGNYNVAASQWAVDLDKRRIFMVDSSQRTLLRWDMDARTLTPIGTTPCITPTTTVQQDKGYLVWDSNAKVIIQSCYNRMGAWAYHPDEIPPRWENLSTLPVQGTTNAPQMNGLTFDPVKNWVVGIGWDGIWLFRYGKEVAPPPPPPVDKIAPQIIGLSSSAATSSAMISFTTSEQATSQISFGLNVGTLGSLQPISSVFSLSHSRILSNLDPNTRYFFRVSAKDASGNERQSAVEHFDTQALPFVGNLLNPIHVIDAAKRTGKTIHLTFEAPDDTNGRTRPQKYELRYVVNDTITASNWNTATSVSTALVPKSKGEKEEFILPNLICGTNYSIGIRGKDSSNNLSDLGSTLNITTKQCPPKPLLITFQFGSVTFSWAQQEYPDGTLTYRIIRVTSTTPPLSITDPNAILIGTTTQTTITDATTAPSTTYTYAIASYADEGEYSEMTTVQVITPAPTPPPPSGGGGGGSSPSPTPTPSPTPAPTLITLPAPGVKYFFTKALYFGIRDSEVIQLQRFFISKRYLASGNDTGFFGLLTESAVKKFQCDNNIVCVGSKEATGYGLVGRLTRAKLNQGSGITNQGKTPPALTEPQRQALIVQITEQIRQLQIKLLELQIRLLQEQLN